MTPTTYLQNAPKTEEDHQRVDNLSKNEEKIVRYSINIPDQLHEDFKISAVREKINMRDVILIAIEEFVNKIREKEKLKGGKK